MANFMPRPLNPRRKSPQTQFDTRLGVDEVEGKNPGRGTIFLLSTSFRPRLGPTQPHIQWVQGVKWPRHEDDYSPPNSAVVKNMCWVHTSIPHYVFVAYCVIKYRANFTGICTEIRNKDGVT
jgi:hypothetical protein